MRLIDADELIKILEEYANDKDSQAIYGEERLRLILGDCKIEIEKFPTAYDVDKVIEQLEERKEYLLKDFVLADKADEVKERTMARINEIDGIIEIVKSGGVADE